ncbi:MAG: hypothetical protein SVE93_02375 [Candidatus Thermoplasmatota archaeon]|nr:hypothetical protein [Candidatus Thermoplasmatota archaeon]
MKALSVVLCVALFFAGVPLIKAQEQPAVAPPVTEQPVIPPDIAKELGNLGMAPLISLGLDFIFAVVNGVIAFVMVVLGALWAKGLGSFLSLLMAWIWVFQSIVPILTYIKGLSHLALCVGRYTPVFACVPNLYNAVKVTLQIIGI